MKCPTCGSSRVHNFYDNLWECKSCKNIANACYGCGELVKDFFGNHHCDPKREKQILDARKSHEELGIEQGHSEYERFIDGMSQL